MFTKIRTAIHDYLRTCKLLSTCLPNKNWNLCIPPKDTPCLCQPKPILPICSERFAKIRQTLKFSGAGMERLVNLYGFKICGSSNQDLSPSLQIPGKLCQVVRRHI
eukprot:s611_g20.t1